MKALTHPRDPMANTLVPVSLGVIRYPPVAVVHCATWIRADRADECHRDFQRRRCRERTDRDGQRRRNPRAPATADSRPAGETPELPLPIDGCNLAEGTTAPPNRNNVCPHQWSCPCH